jgi:hypothetical protein
MAASQKNQEGTGGMTTFPKDELNRVRRLPERGQYDSADIYPIIDEALLCHVGIVQDGQPVVIPTLHARDGDRLLLHGATTSRLLKVAQSGAPLCVSITLMDGLVLARSVFHHSINYRSVVLFGSGSLVDESEKEAVLERFTEKLLPGRWYDARRPSKKELKATAAVAIPIDLISAKIRVGPPKDDEEDYSLPVWAGVLPMRQGFGEPEPDPVLDETVALPDYLRSFVDRNKG